MKRLALNKLAYSLLIITILFSVAVTPQPAYAWSAVTVEAEGSFFTMRIWNIFRDFISSITGRESPQIVFADKGTHQLMMRLAYQFLEKDPAYTDQKEYFPTIDGILGWEGVVAKTDRIFLEGGEWRGRGSKSGGPDAKDKSKDSNHYYNPRTGTGSADTAVESCFKDFLLQMYGHGDFYNRNKPNQDTNHNAAWAAHYLADVYVPYHTVGVSTDILETLRGKLSPEQAGPYYLYQPGEAELVNGYINTDSIIKPPEWSGLDGNFEDSYSYFQSNNRGNVNKDWFDPWYYNGIKGLGPNTVPGSHQLWESWAHEYITGSKLEKVPTAYSKDWKNATPEFNKPLTNIEKQATQTKSFTVAGALETSNNMAIYIKMPDIAFNKATERVATLWRASLTALRPEIKVEPDAGNPKLLKVTATIKSVEPNDPATRVQARLTVDGGTIRGKALHDTDESAKAASGKPFPVSPGSPAAVTPGKTVTATTDKPWVTEWQVDSNNPDDCVIKLEVICEYQKTPDLQYAVCENAKLLKVTISPDKAKPEGKVKLTITVNPPQKVELEIQDGELFKSDWGKLNRDKDGKFKVSTEKNGEFTGDFTIKKNIASGKYDIKVYSPELGGEGKASISVGEIDLSWAKHFRIQVATGVRGDRYAESYTGIKVDEIFEGSFTGNTFQGVLCPKDGYSGSGSVTISIEPTAIPTYFRVTSYSMESNVEIVRKLPRTTVTRTEKCSAEGQPTEDSGHIPIGDSVPVDDFYWWNAAVVSGDAVCRDANVTVVEKTQSSTGTSTETEESYCNKYTQIRMGFGK